MENIKLFVLRYTNIWNIFFANKILKKSILIKSFIHNLN